RRTNMGANLSGTLKWQSIAAGPDGKLYCVPYNATDILIIDPATGRAQRTNMGIGLSGTAKWLGIAAGPDAKLCAVLYSATDTVVIDPATGTARRTNMGVNLSGNSRWAGIAAGPDGKLYCAPDGSSHVLIIEDLAPPITPGLYLKDPSSDDYYTLPEGEVVKQMAFGPVGVGTATAPRPVVVENQVGKAVEHVLIEPEDGLPEGVYVEVSFTEDPFVPESLPLFLQGPFASGQPIVTLWVRVRSETSAPLDQYV